MTTPRHFIVLDDGSLHDTRKGITAGPVRQVYWRAFTRPKNSIELRATIREAYAWPGGYELVGITKDGGMLCNKCCRDNYRLIATARKNNWDDGWLVVGFDCTVNYENGETCDYCGKWLDAYNDQE